MTHTGIPCSGRVSSDGGEPCIAWGEPIRFVRGGPDTESSQHLEKGLW